MKCSSRDWFHYINPVYENSMHPPFSLEKKVAEMHFRSPESLKTEEFQKKIGTSEKSKIEVQTQKSNSDGI